MTRISLDTIGKKMPYTMPADFNPSALMDTAIRQERKKRSIRRVTWLAAPAAAAAIAAAVVLSLPKGIDSSTMQDYYSALSEYCSSASSDELQSRIEMSETDLVCNMDSYQEYYN